MTGHARQNGQAPFGTAATPTYNRRLCDILLSAFNHAYAVGERDIAGRLRDLLSDIEERAPARPDQRVGTGTLSKADLWVDFVEARDRYRRLCEDAAPDAEVAAALETMKDTYRRWSLG